MPTSKQAPGLGFFRHSIGRLPLLPSGPDGVFFFRLQKSQPRELYYSIVIPGVFEGVPAGVLRSTKHLVIGAGQVGAALADALSAMRYPVRVLGRAELDLAEPGKLAGILAHEEFDVVWLTAAETRVDWCEGQRERAFRVNAAAPGEIARICFENRLRFVHFSTDYVFSGAASGWPVESPYVESDEPEPLSAYGESKLAGERAVLSAHPEAAVIRTSAVFSPGGRNFFAAIVQKGEAGGVVKVVDDQIVSPTFAPHLARWLAAHHEHLPCGIVHLAGMGAVNWYKAAVAAFELTGLDPGRIEPVTSAAIERPAKRPPYSVLGSEVLPRLSLPYLPPWFEGLSAWAAARKKAAR